MERACNDRRLMVYENNHINEYLNKLIGVIDPRIDSTFHSIEPYNSFYLFITMASKNPTLFNN